MASLVPRFEAHLGLVSTSVAFEDTAVSQEDELSHTPLFSSDVLTHIGGMPFEQYGLLGKQESHHVGGFEMKSSDDVGDNLIYGNHSEPWSTFICGSQGSGKSHTLANLLENSILTPPPAGELPHPLTAIAFHYDPYTSFSSTQHCELAYLCSKGIKVRILVSPSNYRNMKKLYKNLPGLPDNVPKPEVHRLKLKENQLSVGSMMTLMSVKEDGYTPLYVSVIYKILQDMAENGPNRAGIDYKQFRETLDAQNFAPTQTQMLQLRLLLLEKLVDATPRKIGKAAGQEADIWTFEPGSLTVVDLSCPFVSAGDACALFNVCLGLFLADRNRGGRVVALDEAHKFLTDTGEAGRLTEQLISLIRQQRHLATRVIIATQEPTLDTRLLDLCNVVVVHRFNSPAWFSILQDHLAGSRRGKEKNSMLDEIFTTIVGLPTGHALLFSPTAMLHVEGGDELDGDVSRYISTLKDGYIKIRIRKRTTADGGKSIAAADKYAVPDVISDTESEASDDEEGEAASINDTKVTEEVLDVVGEIKTGTDAQAVPATTNGPRQSSDDNGQQPPAPPLSATTQAQIKAALMQAVRPLVASTVSQGRAPTDIDHEAARESACERMGVPKRALNATTELLKFSRKAISNCVATINAEKAQTHGAANASATVPRAQTGLGVLPASGSAQMKVQIKSVMLPHVRKQYAETGMSNPSEVRRLTCASLGVEESRMMKRGDQEQVATRVQQSCVGLVLNEREAASKSAKK